MNEELLYGKLSYRINDESLYKHFNNEDEVKKWGKEIYGDWAKKYKDTMRCAAKNLKNPYDGNSVECYCGYFYKQINEYLRYGIDNNNNTYRELTDILLLVLCSAPKIPSNLVAYRCVSDEFVDDLIRKNKKGTMMQEKGFMSTSLLKKIVFCDESYTKTPNLLKIYVEKNSIGIYVNGIAHRNEEELLLFPNGYLELKKYPYMDITINKFIYECALIYT